MTYDDVVNRLKDPGFADLRQGGSIRSLYWIRDEGVPVLLSRIEEYEILIDSLRAAVAREGLANQEKAG